MTPRLLVVVTLAEAGGAQTFVATLIAGRMMKNPLGKMFAFDYGIKNAMLRELGLEHRIAMAPTPLGACVLAATAVNVAWVTTPYTRCGTMSPTQSTADQVRGRALTLVMSATYARSMCGSTSGSTRSQICWP